FRLALLPLRLRGLVGFRVHRESGKASSTSRQLGLDGLFLAVQIPPTRVDHGSLGVRNLLRPIFTKQVNRKVFHHVVEEVFLTPSTEQTHTIFHPRSAVSRADQARLMPGDRQLANLSHPQPVFPITDPRPALRKEHRYSLTGGHRDFHFRKLVCWPLLGG